MGEPTLLLLTGLPGTGKSTLAEHGAGRLGACVLAHDWAMAGLRPAKLEPPGDRPDAPVDARSVELLVGAGGVAPSMQSRGVPTP